MIITLLIIYSLLLGLFLVLEKMCFVEIKEKVNRLTVYGVIFGYTLVFAAVIYSLPLVLFMFM